jgi:hypothetical protein
MHQNLKKNHDLCMYRSRINIIGQKLKYQFFNSHLKRSQMSMERLKRSFTMDTIKEKQDGTQSISMEVPTTVITSDTSSPKVTSPLFDNGKCFPDTIYLLRFSGSAALNTFLFLCGLLLLIMVFNATFNNISAIS